MSKVHAFETELYCDLTPDEVRERGEALARVLAEILDTRDDLKEIVKGKRQEIRALELRSVTLGNATRFRRELRTVTVEVVDAGEGRCHEVRVDTREVIRTRRMTPAEQQMTVPTIGDETKRATA